MKPILVYVDDEPRNLTVFEASVSEEWEVYTFDNAVEALKVIKEIKPWIILSDQRMPIMTGLELLEIAHQILPETIRMVVTGFTEEKTIIEFIRRAKVFDFITKPWDTESFLIQIQKAIDYYLLIQERKKAILDLEFKTKELDQKNMELQLLTKELEISKQKEVSLRDEIGAWAPAPIVWAIKEKTMSFPATKDLVCITYDIVNSSSISGKIIENRSIKSHVLHLFTEALLKKGGIRESTSGDSVYGHFGAIPIKNLNPFIAALSVAQEFRVMLRSFSRMSKIELECGIALHFSPSTLIQIHETSVDGPIGKIIQKSFDTDSPHIDLLHRMEKITHILPGTNIIMSKDFLNHIENLPENIIEIGTWKNSEKDPSIDLHLIKSDLVSDEKINQLKIQLNQQMNQKNVIPFIKAA